MEIGSDCNVQADELSSQGDGGGDTVDNTSVHVEVQVDPDSTIVGPEVVSSMERFVPTILEQPGQTFQAQLDSIDEELTRYEEGGDDTPR